MASDGILLTAFIKVLIEKLESNDLMKMGRSVGLSYQLKKWGDNLLQIQALLADAGEKGTRDKFVQVWLNELQHLVYDIDDVLDDLATEAIRRELNEANKAVTTRKLSKMIPTCCTTFPRHLMYGHQFSSKVDNITTRLHDLVKEKNALGLMVIKLNGENSEILSSPQEVDESIIVGRQGEIELLMAKLLQNIEEECGENCSIIPIVGMGGVGKTTLAQALYNDKRVKDHFELMTWVCVSDDFDVFNISNAIFQAVTGLQRQFATLDLLHVALKDQLSGKRFLLVLDDLWNEDYRMWELLQRPFLAAAPGSKVIITTRRVVVAEMVGSAQHCMLDTMSDDNALLLFALSTLGEPNFNKHPTLRSYAEGIVKKCYGLPLALVMLGRTLRTEREEDKWEKVLNSEIWQLDASGILPALTLCYSHLSPNLKQLFAYCSLFPKDYMFDKNELVLLWMAEGFLSKLDGNKSMERLGDQYFQELLSRSFFQHSINNKSRYIMHDLIKDLATSVAGEYFLLLDDSTSLYGRKKTLFEKLRHFSFMGQLSDPVYKMLKEVRHLRTFLSLSVNDDGQKSYLPDKVVEPLPQLPFLRVLSLANHSITQLPDPIGMLKHIRYINFSKTNIKRLPEEFSSLYNLQSLLVRGCYELSTLPKSFVKLVNLRHLDISDTPKLNKLPLGIGGLTSLQTLSKVFIEGANGFDISELKGLQNLQGNLSITGLDNVTDALQAQEANLHQKKGLDGLEMEWSDDFDDSRKVIEYETLVRLRPPSNLRKLTIMSYGGMKFPSWVGDPCFHQLTELTLCGCRSCTHLPTLGRLPSLQKLSVGSMDEVKTIGFELLAPDNSSHDIPAFPSLEVLEFKDMQYWEVWSTKGGGSNSIGRSFPCLNEISLVYCPKLIEFPEALLPGLSRLIVHHCPELKKRFHSTKGNYWPIISQIPDYDII